VDLTGLGVGTYQLIPDVVVAGLGVTVQSILPGTVEVTIAKGTPTPPVPTVTTTPAATPTK
jgi:hypothetical protein